MFPDIEEVKKRRNKLGLTQKQLSAMCNVSQSIIAKIESKKINPSYSITKRIFNVLEGLEHKEGKKSKDIMNPRIISINKNSRVSKAVKLMQKHGYSQLPVIDGKQYIGSISDKTISDMIYKGSNISDIYKRKIKDIMEESFPKIDGNASIKVISSLLQYSPAVLIIKGKDTIGIVTKSDLLKVL